jgi:septum formation topological specificity factor MinE
VKKEKEPYDKNIDDILAVISEYIEIENSKLTDIYKLVM